MKDIGANTVKAVIVGMALLMATPALANADTPAGPAARQQAIQAVIARALAQRGVPYSYGGGNATGPTLGTPSAPDATPVAATPSALAGANVVPGANLVSVDPTAGPGGPASAPPAPSVVGFDSSGLIQYAFAGVGLKLPRSSGEQYKIGRKVLPAEALPGDLLFFGPDGTQSVALFVGNGQMLEGTQPSVTLSPVRTNGMAPYLSRIIEW